MTPNTALLITLGYVSLLLLIARWSAKQSSGTEQTFFVANKSAPWYVVAFGMVGASLSGVTFLSIPGWVGSQSWTYLQMVIGYSIGYLIVATVLLPLYYKLNLTSIYGYLNNRFGREAHKTGAAFFLLSRIIGASFRLFLVALVIDVIILEPWHGEVTPGWMFGLTTAGILGVIYLYTKNAGMGTVIWTDTLQTAAMLVAVILTITGVVQASGSTLADLPAILESSNLTQIWVTEDWRASNFWVKHILAGMFVTIAMTGLDQDMMQKNLTCRNLKEAQWNMGSFTVILVVANMLFLTMGALLFVHAEAIGMTVPAQTDRLYPMLAMGGTLGPWMSWAFLVGLLASAFSSADSALTSLTTSVCVDFADTPAMDDQRAAQTRRWVHAGMAGVLWLVILVFRGVNDTSVVAALFTVANYTYGPLLGLFAVGMFSSWRPHLPWVPYVCVLAPVLGYGLEQALLTSFGFSFGFALLPVNGLLTALGLGLISRVKSSDQIKA